MTTQQTYKLTMTPKAWLREGVQMYSGPVFMYEINGPLSDNFQLVQTSAEGKEPTWRVRNLVRDTYAGEYKTPEEALAALEAHLNMLDNPFFGLDKFALCKFDDCEDMVHTSSYIAPADTAFGNDDTGTRVMGAIMKCDSGHASAYQGSDFHEKQDWAKYEINPFNHVTSHEDAAACCVGEPHGLGGVHMIRRLSWKKSRSYCVVHLIERANFDPEFRQAWDEYVATSPRMEKHRHN